jgi:hypothetical protein
MTMIPKEKIMIVGVGELGGILLEYLCRIPNICDIITADSNQDWGFRKTNSAILGAAYMGLYPNIHFHQVDLLNVEKTAELLGELKPAIIFNGTTLQSWWVVNELPPEVNAQLYKHRSGLGTWVSMHLALTTKLMKAVEMSGINTYVVNSSFPDVTNVSLDKIGIAPVVGIGNCDLLMPYIQKTAAELLGIPMAAIRVEMIGHHYHCYDWARKGIGHEAPHYLRIYNGHEDITDQLGDMKAFVSKLPEHAMRPGGRHGQYLVAASALKNIMAIYNDTNELTNAPGPNGLEGGYPVRLSRKGAEVVLPQGITLPQARELNCQAQQYDGIQEIQENGDIVLTDEAHNTLKEILDVDCRTVTIDYSFEQAMELKKKFGAFAQKHGVKVPA